MSEETAQEQYDSMKAEIQRRAECYPALVEALTLLRAEMIESGNGGSTDYGWKPAIEKTNAALKQAGEME